MTKPVRHSVEDQALVAVGWAAAFVCTGWLAGMWLTARLVDRLTRRRIR